MLALCSLDRAARGPERRPKDCDGYSGPVRPSIGQPARSSELRTPRGRIRSAACLILAAVAVLALAACGSSSSSTSTAAAGSTGSVTSPGTAQSQTTAISVPGCRSVPAPASRAGEEVSKPTAQLDPARSYTVRLATNCGPIVIQLAVKEAPKTTASFVHLVQTGYYNGLTFHRVVPGFVIQGGDPNGNGSGGPKWEVVEPPPANLHYTKGVVAMAKSGSAPAGASGSQFFIVAGPSTNLPPEYALVGHVISGENAVEAISHVPTEASPEGGESSKPRVPIVIEHATLVVH
jgi:peptidyl-prolyl cis-trans isomerase B (cyclophilin B)